MRNIAKERTENTLRGALFAMGAESADNEFDWSLDSPVGNIDWIVEGYPGGYVVTCQVPYADLDKLADLAITPELVEIANSLLAVAFREYIGLCRKNSQSVAV